MNEQTTIIGWQRAADVTGWSVAELRRRVEDGRLQTKQRKGRYHFLPADLEALRDASTQEEHEAHESPKPEPSSPAAPEMAPPITAIVPTTEGELAALVFGDLEAGTTPTRIVADRKIAPALVRELHKAWQEMRDGSSTVVAERFATLEKRLDEQAASHKQLVDEFGAVRDRVYGMPLPSKADFKCKHCGKTGYPTVTVECGLCNGDNKRGFWPKPGDG